MNHQGCFECLCSRAEMNTLFSVQGEMVNSLGAVDLTVSAAAVSSATAAGSSHIQHSAWALITLNLQKQESSWIWPKGCTGRHCFKVRTRAVDHKTQLSPDFFKGSRFFLPQMLSQSVCYLLTSNSHHCISSYRTMCCEQAIVPFFNRHSKDQNNPTF